MIGINYFQHYGKQLVRLTRYPCFYDIKSLVDTHKVIVIDSVMYYGFCNAFDLVVNDILIKKIQQ